MAYETSYDAGMKPFNHDKSRGKWASSTDFLFACIGNAFRLDAIFVVPSMMFQDLGYFVLIPYFIIVVICTIPIVFIQSFLGQFSSTGFISVFRISPLFKGIGYVSLAVNITTLTYYSILSAIPFFYFLHSLRPTLPWSCEGAGEWYDYSENFTTHCNLSKIEVDTDDFIVVESPSLDFFQYHLNISPSRMYRSDGVTFSWSLMFCALATWVLVWFVLRKPTEMIGRILRYSHLAMFAMLGLCFFRFIFLPHAFESLVVKLGNRFSRRYDQSIVSVPLMALAGLGPGWGTILTMASYNNFKTDITKYSWALCIGQFLLMFVGSLSLILIESFMHGLHPSGVHMILNSNQWEQIISLPTALSLLEMPNFWSLLYFGVLFIGTTNLLIVQLFSVLTSLFDEYEKLRDRKDEVLYGCIGVLAIGSMLFCCNHGIKIFEFMSGYTVVTQIFLNLMLLLVVLWVYGRERLQRDVHFMTNRTYPTWMVYIVRFIAPIFLLFSFLIGLIIALLETDYSVPILFIITAVILLPWLLIPAYCIFKIMQTTGFVGMRLRRCVRPMDWYPAEPNDRQRYEETFGNSDITHQLTTPEGEEEAVYV